MRVTVITVEKYDPTRHKRGPEQEAKTIDWTDSSDRKWLMNHLHWAMHNQRIVKLAGPNAA